MHQIFLAAVFATLLASIAGCGGGNSQSSLRKRASRGSPDSDGDGPPAAAKAAPAANKSPPPASAKAQPAPAPQQAKATPPQQAVSSLPPPPSSALIPTPFPSGSASITVVVKNEKPEKALSPAERRARTAENMEKIGRALAAYVAKYGRLPPQALRATDGNRSLSWRVVILPELGYPELFKQFNGNEAWNGPHNKELLAQIPPEYQSPERFDTKTNYVGASERGMALESLEGVAPEAMKDGMDNTIAVFEADDGQAKPWTQPLDYIANLEEPMTDLGHLRAEGTFTILASGRVAVMPRGFSEQLWRAFCSHAGGEAVQATALLLTPPRENVAASTEGSSNSPANEPEKPTSIALVDHANLQASVGKPAVANSAPIAPEITGLVPKLQRRRGELLPVDSDKTPLPDESSLAKARAVLKEVYKDKDESSSRTADDRKKANSWMDDRKKLVTKLLDGAGKVPPDSADRFEMLRVARDEAAKLGDVKSALAACERLEKQFQVDPLTMRLKVLDALVKAAKTLNPLDTAFNEAYRLTREAFDADRYDVAIPAHGVMLEIGRITVSRAEPPKKKGLVPYKLGPRFGTPDTPQEKKLKAELMRFERLGEQLEAAQLKFDDEQKALVTIKTNPADSAACETVGKYLCFVKNQWDDGLPFLARAADIKLRILALIDLNSDRSPQETISLGDQYWEMAEKLKKPEQRGLHLRAVLCYATEIATAAGSLEKFRWQKRIDEAATLYGREDVDRLLPKSQQPQPISPLSDL